jgi:hypothetical protein
MTRMLVTVQKITCKLLRLSCNYDVERSKSTNIIILFASNGKFRILTMLVNFNPELFFKMGHVVHQKICIFE